MIRNEYALMDGSSSESSTLHRTIGEAVIGSDSEYVVSWLCLLFHENVHQVNTYCYVPYVGQKGRKSSTYKSKTIQGG